MESLSLTHGACYQGAMYAGRHYWQQNRGWVSVLDAMGSTANSIVEWRRILLLEGAWDLLGGVDLSSWSRCRRSSSEGQGKRRHEKDAALLRAAVAVVEHGAVVLEAAELGEPESARSRPHVEGFVRREIVRGTAAG